MMIASASLVGAFSLIVKQMDRLQHQLQCSSCMKESFETNSPTVKIRFDELSVVPWVRGL